MSLLLLTPAELAEALSLDPTWVERRIAKYPHHRFGRSIRLTEADALAFIDAHAVQPTDALTVEVPPALLELKPGRAPRRRRTAS